MTFVCIFLSSRTPVKILLNITDRTVDICASDMPIIKCNITQDYQEALWICYVTKSTVKHRRLT